MTECSDCPVGRSRQRGPFGWHCCQFRTVADLPACDRCFKRCGQWFYHLIGDPEDKITWVCYVCAGIEELWRREQETERLMAVTADALPFIHEAERHDP